MIRVTLLALAKIALVIATAIWTCSCTTVYYPNGKKLACIGSDIDSMDIQARGIVVHAVRIQNSTIVRAHGDNITKGGTAIATSGVLRFLRTLK